MKKTSFRAISSPVNCIKNRYPARSKLIQQQHIYILTLYKVAIHIYSIHLFACSVPLISPLRPASSVAFARSIRISDLQLHFVGNKYNTLSTRFTFRGRIWIWLTFTDLFIFSPQYTNINRFHKYTQTKYPEVSGCPFFCDL